MEQAITRARRTGWSDDESRLLWETADEAQQQGLPLKAVFERIAEKTGRRPNSIRNYYYAQVQKREGGAQRPARFVPFTQQEVDWLMEQVLTARAQGQSVRSCLQSLAGGDHSLMLRYQNKYRAVLKSRPEYVQKLVEALNARGVACETPQVNHRVRPDVGAACQTMVDEARRAGDAELARACETLALPTIQAMCAPLSRRARRPASSSARMPPRRVMPKAARRAFFRCSFSRAKRNSSASLGLEKGLPASM